MSTQWNLPQFEPSYETIIHKKVYHYSHILIIPEGELSYVWIHNKGSFLINKSLGKKKIFCSNHPSLQKGTLLEGVYFQYNNVFFFAIQDIFYYKGVNISRSSFEEKLRIFGTILKNDIQQQPADEIIFGLPILVENEKWLKKYIEKCPYPIQYIQYRNALKQRGNHRFQLPFAELNDNYCVMNVSADIQHDIYHLTGTYNKKPYGTACIPDYKTSVFMNSIFRNIKENANLDAIEESDEEEEEGDEKYLSLDSSTNLLKFVDITLVRQMKCKYHSHFKKWIPIELINEKEKD